ncbi:MAG: copper-containing nitrite reductase [Candidatus Pacebacteria bacterium]|nr:copper-containing nitrite reductase [Candidatus Paceibacterota bacterium]
MKNEDTKDTFRHLGYAAFGLFSFGIVSAVIMIFYFGLDNLLTLLPLIYYSVVQGVAITIAVVALSFFVLRIVYRLHSKLLALTLAVIVAGALLYMWADKTYSPHFAMPAFMHVYHPGGSLPDLPFKNVLVFIKNFKNFEFVEDIGADPNTVPPPINRTEPALVRIELTAQEVISEVAPGVYFNYWTFNKQVPGPMLRVREGDTVEVTLTNHHSSLHHHNIDLHAVTGPGGGATLSKVNPGETRTFSWKALNPGLYIYHCATPNVSTHNSHGQYGLILVEPKEGLQKVDKEFYIVQGELYTKGVIGKKGLTIFDGDALLDEEPNYITFNGRIEKDGIPRMSMKVGETARIYVGNGGVGLISSFHPIGEIFDTVYPEGGIGGNILKNIQTTAVLPGGAAIVEFKAEIPGAIVLVDHALARMNKGAWAIINVEGEENPEIYRPGTSDDPFTQGSQVTPASYGSGSEMSH